MKDPKVLLFDVETFANVIEAWGIWEVNAIRVVKEWELASFAYKWLGEKDIKVVTREGQKTDKQLCVELHKVLSQADVVIAHNGDSFDNKKVRTRMLFHGLEPTAPYKQIDTKKLAKARFAFTSNSLDALGQFLGVGRKEKTGGYELWKECLAGKKSAWVKMAKYNKQDVALLERVYLKLLPWSPSINLTYEGRPEACPKCGSEKLRSKGVRSGKRTFICVGCGGYCHMRVTEKGYVKPMLRSA